MALAVSDPGSAGVLGAGWDRHRAAAARRGFAVASVPGIVLAAIVLGALIVPLGPLLAVVVAVVAGIVVSVVLWQEAPTILLRALGAVPADEERWPRPFGLVDALCATMGLPAPRLWVLDSRAANALTLGTRPGSMALVVTTGLLDRLDPVCLEGVLAHELVHVKRGDVAVGTIASVLALPLARIADVGRIVHRLRGPGNELATDQLAVGMTRYPPGLRDGLQAMASASESDALCEGAPALCASAAGKSTRWLWTVLLGPAPEGEAVIGELDAPEVRIAALDEL